MRRTVTSEGAAGDFENGASGGPFLPQPDRMTNASATRAARARDERRARVRAANRPGKSVKGAGWLEI